MVFPRGAMHGVPWTPAKMRAAAQLRADDSVGFVCGAEPLERLAKLDAQVFAKRPDLRLHVWPHPIGRVFSAQELATIASLPNVRRLWLSGFRNKRFDALGAMKR